MGFVVGVDVGGTAAKIAVFDEEGTMLGSSQVRTRLEDGGKHILPDISREVRALLSGLGIGKSTLFRTFLKRHQLKIALGTGSTILTG